MSLSPSGAAGNVIPKGYKTGQLQQFTPEQMQLFKQNFAFTDPNGMLFKRAMGSEEGFEPYEQRAMRDFQDFQGQTASRFSLGGGGPGAMSARHGSGFQNAQTQGAQDFASQLALQRESLRGNALDQLRGLSSELLGQRPYEQFLQKKKPKFLEALLGGLGDYAGLIPQAYMAHKGIEKSGGGSEGLDWEKWAQIASMAI